MRKKTAGILLLCLLASPLSADMGPSIPDTFWAFGPSLGYTWSDNLSGFTLGFEALRSWTLFTYSAGARYTFSDDDKPDFNGNNGLLSFYVEGTIALPFPLGIGASYNFALGSGSGPGLQMYFGFPLPIHEKFYVSLFWRPHWIWIDGNPETMHEFGIYIKRSNLRRKMSEAARRKYEWRRRLLQKQKKKRKNRTTPGGTGSTNARP